VKEASKENQAVLKNKKSTSKRNKLKINNIKKLRKAKAKNNQKFHQMK